MTTYLEERLPGAALSARRSLANELFLSNYLLATYGGCEFACPYCDLQATMTRPLGETTRALVDVPARLADEIADIDAGDVVGLLLTDAYQPAERTYHVTRDALTQLTEYGQPTVILTKSPLVVEDLPTLQRLQARAMVVVIFTLLTTEQSLSEKLEHHAPPPALRLEAARQLKRAGIPVGFAMLPIVPYVTDQTSHLARTLNRISDTGADFVVWEHLGWPNERHKERIDAMLGQIARIPSAYYRDLYGNRLYPSLEYRRKIDEEILRRVDILGMDVRVPHRIYHRHISPANELSLLFKHHAFRDATQGRDRLAALHRSLAEEAYRGRFDQVRMQQSPLWPTVQTILNPPKSEDESGAAGTEQP
ncbi:MAG: radical SAM protein [Herpetosiphonaceae bacterium]|nr:radical SAM protein [Herpetosiphonaceae bacterium]